MAYNWRRFKMKKLIFSVFLLLMMAIGAMAQTVLFSEDFEGGSMPTGWTVEGPGTWIVGTGDYYSSTGAGEGSYNALIEHNDYDDVTKLITPEIDLSSVTSAQLSFMHVQRSWEGDIDELRVYYRASSSEEWVQLLEFTDAVESWTTEEGIVLPNTSSTYQLAFEMTDNYGYGVGIDYVNIIPPASCPKPTALVFSNITTSYVSMSWTPGSSETHWNFQYKKSTITEWGDDVTALTAPTCYISGLEAGTSYDVRIQADCESDGTSPSWLTGTFTTAYGIPFVEEFATETKPANWSMYSGLLSDVMDGTAYTPYSYGWDFEDRNIWESIHAYTNVYGTSNMYWLVTPNIMMDANVQLTFNLALTAYDDADPADTDGTDDKFVVLVSTDGGENWTILRQYDNAGSEYVYNNIPAAGEEVTIDLSSYSSGSVMIAFYTESTESNADNDIHIDNVTLDYIPTCIKPISLAASNVTNESATITWTAGADETAWQISINDGSPIDLTEPIYNMSELTAATAYTVKVRANCGEGDVSPWATVTFRTNICANEDMCQIRYELRDPGNYGYGWFGAAINVIDAETDIVLATLALEDGDISETGTLSVCNGRVITFEWVDGMYDDEVTAYAVYDLNGVEIFSGSGAMLADENYTVDCSVDYCAAPYGLDADATNTTANLSWNGNSDNYVVRYRSLTPVFFDNFENGLGNWTIYTEGDDGAKWKTINPMDGLSKEAHSGDSVAAAFSWSGSAYNADNWLVTSQIALGGVVKFWVNTNGGYPDHYEVLLSLTGNEITDFTTTLRAMEAASGDWTEISIDLSEYDGMGYIAIHHEDYDANYLLVDDFGLYTPGEWTEVNATGTSLEITGLTPATNYEYQVLSQCEDPANDNWSVMASFITDPNTYIITASAGENGAIYPEGEVVVIEGESQDFEIYADPNYRIASVLVDGEDVIGSLVDDVYTFFNVVANHTIEVAFEEIPVTYTITATAGENGTINPNGDVVVEEGATQVFTIVANENYRIASVLVDDVESIGNLVDSVYTFTNVTANHTIAATFEEIPTHTLTIHYLYADNTPAAEDHIETVVEGAEYSVASPAVTGYTADPLVVEGTMPAQDVEVTVTYTINTYTITATAGENGTITPNGEVDVNYGATQAFTIEANGGYRIMSVLVDGAEAISELVDGVYTFTNVTANHTIAATFVSETATTHTITATAGENGTITPAGTIEVVEGENKSFTIEAATGYHIVSVMVDDTVNVTEELVDGVYTFTNVTADHTIAAAFAINNYIITATAGDNGTITPAQVSVNHGASQEFTITANEGFRIASVMVDETEDVTAQLVEDVYTFVNVTANHTIAATFEAIPVTTYTITATAGDNGTITPSGAVSVEEGADQPFEITPNANYEIDVLTVDSNEITLTEDQREGFTYTFTNVVAGHTINVTFRLATSVEINNAASMAVYPNPNNGMFSIDFSNIEGDATYQLIDARGVVVETRDINVMNGETMNFNHNLRAGAYFVRIINGDKVYVEQIVVE